MADYVVNGTTYTQGPDGHYYPQGGAAPSGLERPPMAYTPMMVTKTANPYAQSSIQSQATVDAGKATMTPEQIAQSRIETQQKALDLQNAIRDSKPLGDMTKTGPAFLATLPPRVRNLVDMVGTNQMLVNSMGLRNAQVQQFVTAAKQGYPRYDPSLAPVRQNAIYDYSGGGKQSLAIQAMDRAASTMQLMKSYSDKMGGSQTGYAPLNAHVAATQQDVGKDRIVASQGFTTLMPDLMGQLSTVLGANGASAVSDRKEVKEGFTPDASLDQRNKAFEVISQAIVKASGEFRQGWNSAANPGGGNIPPPTWLSHDSADFLEKMAGVKPGTMGADIPHDMNSQNQYAATGVMPAATTPPGSGGNGGGSGGLTPSNGGPVTSMYSPETQAGLAGLARGGASVDQANAYLAGTADGKGYQVTPDNWASTQKWLSDYKAKNGSDYTGPLNAVKSDSPTPAQDAVSTLGLNGSIGAGLANYANSAALGVPAWLSGPQGQANLAQLSQDHGVASFIGNAAGFGTSALAGGLGIGAGAAKLAGSEATPALLRSGASWLAKSAPATQAVSDTLTGGVFGSSSDPEHPILGAIAGAGGGLAGNLLGQAIVSPALRYAAETAPGQAVASGLSRMVGAGSLAPSAPVSAADSLVSKTAAPDIGTIAQKLTDAQAYPGLPYTPADATPQLGSLLGSATRHNPAVAGAVDNFVTGRVQNAPIRANQAINELAPTSSADAIATDVTARARTASQPHYDAAYAEDPVVSANLQKILAKPPVQTALKDASDMATTEGFQPVVTNPDGSTAYPIRTLHYTQQALDDMLQSPKYQNADGTMNNKGRILSGVRADLANETQDLSDNFKTAQQTYANIAGQGDAAAAGQSLLKGSAENPVDAASTIASTPPPNIPYLQQGYATQMADNVGRLRGVNPSNPFTSANGNGYQRANLNQVFPDGADRFNTQQGLENDMAATNNAVFGNSLTAQRQAADAQFAPPTGAGSMVGGLAMDAAMMHGGVLPVNSMAKVGGKIVGPIWARMTGSDPAAAASGLAAGVAPTLLNPDPAASLAQLKAIIAADQARQAYLAQSRMAGGAIGGAAATPGAVSALGILTAPSN